MELPKPLESVLADIRHMSETGKHQWYEVVYHDGERWQCYAGSDTFNDGESVNRWKYTKDIFVSSQLDLLVIKAAVPGGDFCGNNRRK
jgi:endoglucanase Acf2